jgi:hypothetical protein
VGRGARSSRSDAWVRTPAERLHPANGTRNGSISQAPRPQILVVSDDNDLRVVLSLMLPQMTVRNVPRACDTEGLGTAVVVIGGRFPLYELMEVRVHPKLWDKPVVLFAPGREVPMDEIAAWGVWLITAMADPWNQLVRHIRTLIWSGTNEAASM